MLNVLLFLFEVTDKLPSVEYMYVSGLMFALLVFGATYFHRQVGMVILFFVGLSCAQNIETPEIIQQIIVENGQHYIDHWNYSCRITLALSIILFFAAIILKRKLKKRNKIS